MFSTPDYQRRRCEQENALYESKCLSSPIAYRGNSQPFDQTRSFGKVNDLRRPLSSFSTNVQPMTFPSRPALNTSPSHCSIFSHMPPSPPETPKNIRFGDPFDAIINVDTSKSKMMQQVEQRRQPQTRPMAKTSEQRIRERREGFLNRVREKQDSRRWDVRSDQILHDDYITQKRAWEEELARSAPSWDFDSADEPTADERVSPNQRNGPPHQNPQTDMNMNISISQPGHNEQAEIEALLDAEARELDALIALHEASQGNPHDDEEGLYIEDFDDEELWNDLQENKASVANLPMPPSTYNNEDDDKLDQWVKQLPEDSNIDDAMDIS